MHAPQVAQSAYGLLAGTLDTMHWRVAQACLSLPFFKICLYAFSSSTFLRESPSVRDGSNSCAYVTRRPRLEGWGGWGAVQVINTTHVVGLKQTISR